jgi:hypothetical protein
MAQILITMKEDTIQLHLFSNDEIENIIGDNESEVSAAQEILAKRSIRDAQEAVVREVAARLTALPTTELPNGVVVNYKQMLGAVLALKKQIEDGNAV